jgi:class 3 adenylate cyclase/alpha-beta hydrolase superfamily lysophospholipase
MHPRTSYARVGTEHVAYQVVGDGDLDVLFVPEWATHLETQWEDPTLVRFLEALGKGKRLILFDKRGVGISDPIAHQPGGGLDPWMEDVTAVLDAVKSEAATLVGTGAGGPVTMLYAASHPERVRGLALVNSAARFVRAPDYDIGTSPELIPTAILWTRETWGTGALFEAGAPSLADSAAARDFYARLQRQSFGPSTAANMQETLLGIDVRSVLPLVQASTLILHRRGDRLVDIEHGRYLAAKMPHAKLVELDGDDHLYYSGDFGSLISEINEFVTGAPGEIEPDRVLATVLFTDIVGSTDRAVSLGDAQWRDLLDRHDATVRANLARYNGREIDTAGDGFFATFDGPARALRCACSIRDDIHRLGLDIRIGVHTGEVEVRGNNYAGIGVHIGARVGARAEAGEVLVTRTVADLVAGSGIEFADRGSARLKGVPGEWQLAAVTAA